MRKQTFLTFPLLSSLRRRIYAAGRERSGVESKERVLENVTQQTSNENAKVSDRK